VSRAYGWTSDGDIIDTEAVELRTMADHIADGGSMRSLVQDLETRGVATVTGKPWAPITVRRALTNPRIIGMKLDKAGDLIPADIPPILGKRIYNKVNKILTDPARAKFAPHGGRSDTLMPTGMVICGTCGSTMHASTREGRAPDYACSSRAGGCGGVAIAAHLLDTEVTERVLARLANKRSREKLARTATRPASEYQRQIDQAHERMVVLAETFGGADGYKPALDAGVAAARKVIAQAERDLQIVQAEGMLPPPSIDEIVDWWEETPRAIRQEVLTLLVDKVQVFSTKVNPDERLKLHWK
jgi:hypothetical protein